MEINYRIETRYDPQTGEYGCLIRALDAVEIYWFPTEERRDSFIAAAKAYWFPTEEQRDTFIAAKSELDEGLR